MRQSGRWFGLVLVLGGQVLVHLAVHLELHATIHGLNRVVGDPVDVAVARPGDRVLVEDLQEILCYDGGAGVVEQAAHGDRRIAVLIDVEGDENPGLAARGRPVDGEIVGDFQSGFIPLDEPLGTGGFQNLHAVPVKNERVDTVAARHDQRDFGAVLEGRV